MIDASSDPIIIPVVTPQTGDPSSSGRVRNLPVSDQAIPAWLEKRGGGRYAVKGVYAERGYVLLQDLYKAEDDEEGWAKYKRYLAAWKAGTARVSFPLESLPKEVQRRQRTLLADNEFGGEFATPPKPTTGDAHPLPVKRTAPPSSTPSATPAAPAKAKPEAAKVDAG
jgi:hypothetical protein